VRKIIDHYQAVLVARNTRNRRSPQITVNKIKGMHRMRRRGRKRKANMATQLAHMTEDVHQKPECKGAVHYD
jgi:hypothetical protein